MATTSTSISNVKLGKLPDLLEFQIPHLQKGTFPPILLTSSGINALNRGGI